MRRGATLLLVLFVLALVGGLAVGGAFVTRQLVASASTTGRGGELASAAERAIIDAIAQWDTLARASQAIGTSAALASDAANAIETQAWVTRLGVRTYWLVAESRSGSPPSLTRRISAVVTASESRVALVLERAWSDLP